MLVWSRSFQKIHKLVVACNKGDLQKFNKTCYLMVNKSQNRKCSGVSNSDALVTKADIDKFNGIFPRVVEELTEEKQCVEFRILNEHFARLLEYVVPHGKKFRGLMVVGSYKMLEKELTEEKLAVANIVGWMVELFQSYFLIADDMVDNSEMRRGVPCWHTKMEIGTNAINDAFYLYEGVFFLLNRYFGKHKNYIKMFDLIHECALKTAKGQVLDTMFAINRKPNLSVFTMSRHKIYCELKTSYYTVYMPILLAMLMTEFPFTKTQNQHILNLSLKIGHFFQIQDDYIDCYGKKIGKSGNDIVEGKCSWLVVSALKKANSKQRELIEKYYGVPDTEATTAIKKLYDELNIPKIYKGCMNEFFNDINDEIRRLPKELPHELFIKIANYCRTRETSFV